MHEAIGLWMLATVAARRVCLSWSGGVFTNLYLANCARSSLFTKTTAAEIGINLIRKAGIAPLLMPDEKGKNKGFELEIEPLPVRRYQAEPAVFDAFYAYRGALKAVTRTLELDDLDPSYSRFPMKAMRVALLFASLEGSMHIEMRHWARAQAITERWRANLHNLIDQLQTAGEAGRESTLESCVLQLRRPEN
jgi:hypothetical protein